MRSLILRDWEVRGILDGRLTQLRRVVKPQPTITSHGDTVFPWATFYACGHIHTWDRNRNGGQNWDAGQYGDQDEYAEALRRTPYGNPCPLGVPGEVRWCKEAWHCDVLDLDSARAMHEDLMSASPVFYKATEEVRNPNAGWRWRGPVTIPRWASRLTVEVVSVSVERVEEKWWWVGKVRKVES